MSPKPVTTLTMITRMTLALTATLAAGCVDVPPRTTLVDGAADVQVFDRGSDAMAADRGPDVALGPDATPTDGAPDSRQMDAAPIDAAGDMAPVDAALDGPPDMAVVDAEVDGPPDVMPPDMGPVDPLMFSDCLPLQLQVPQEALPAGPVPCLQVAVGAEMPERSSWREAVALDESRVAFIGGLGVGADGMSLASRRVDIYDADRAAWTDAPPLLRGRWSHGAAHWTGDGADELIVLGGAERPVDSQWTGLSDGLRLPAGQPDWTIRRVLPGTLADGAIWSDADGIWFIGGHTAARAAGSQAVVSWRPGQEPVDRLPLTVGRYGHAVASLLGQPIVIGGATVGGSGDPSLEVLGFDGWQRVGDDRLRRVHAEALTIGRRILVAGGRPVAYDFAAAGAEALPDRRQDTLYIRRPAAGGLAVADGPPMFRPRFTFTLSPIGPDPGFALAVGGETTLSGQPIVEVYQDLEPLGGWWPFVLPPPADVVRSFQAAATLPDGRVVIAGGVQGGAPPAEVFMNQTLVFRLTPGGRPDIGPPPDGID